MPTAVTRYVNTASTPGGDGTTNATSGSTRAYASLSEAEAAEQADLVSADEALTIICMGSTADTTAVTFAGWTTDATRNITIKTDAGESNSRHSGVYSTSHYRLSTSYSTFTASVDNIIVDGLQFEVGGGADDYNHRGMVLGNYDVEVKNCIFKFDLAGAVSYGSGSQGINGGVDSSGVHKISNCLFYDFSKTNAAGIRTVNYSGGAAYIYHCTFHNCTYGTYDGYSDMRVQNCVFASCTTDMQGGHNAASNYNCSTGSSLQGSNQQTSLTLTFDDESGDDFHTSDTDLEVANNLYSDGNIAITDDVDGDARPSSGDVYAGFDEPAASGATGTASGDLPSLTGSASGSAYTAISGTGAGDLPSLTGSASGTAVTDITGTASGELSSLTGAATGTVGGAVTGTAAGSLPSLTGAAAGTAGTVLPSTGSQLYVEQDIDVVKLTLNKKDGSGSTTLYLGREFFAANEVYTGSPTIYPLLSEDPQLRRGVGDQVSIRYDVTFACFSQTAYDTWSKTLHDMKDEYEFHGSSVQALYYAKPLNNTTTNAASNIRQTLEIIDVNWNEETVELIARDVTIKERSLAVKFNTTDHPNADGAIHGNLMETVIGASSSGRGGPKVWGSWVDIESDNDGSGTTCSAQVFTGYTPDGLQNEALQQVYIETLDENALKQNGNKPWNQLNLVQSGDKIYSAAPTGTAVQASLQKYTFADLLQPTSALVLSQIIVDFNVTGTVTGQPPVRIAFYYAEQTPAGNWSPVGAPIREKYVDLDTLKTSGSATIVFEDFVVIAADSDVLCIYEWPVEDNAEASAATVQIDAKPTHADSSRKFYYFEKVSGLFGRTGEFMQSAASEPYLETTYYQVWSGTSGVEWEQGNGSYSYLTIECECDNNVMIWENLRIQTQIDGLEDATTPAGAYSNPAEILETLLSFDAFGGDYSSNINTSQFAAVATKLTTAGIVMHFNLRERVGLRELIADICRQARIIFHTDRDGKLSLHYPEYTETPDAVFSESQLRGDLIVQSVDDNDHDTVVNDFLQSLGVFQLNADPTPRLQRKRFINPDGAPGSDNLRPTKAQLSQDLYGRRENRLDLDKIEDDDVATFLVRHWFDVSYDLQTTCVIRIPRRKYFSLRDVFDTIGVTHSAIPNKSGSQTGIKAHDDGTKLTAYADGVPVQVSLHGNLRGAVLQCAEFGPWYELVIETVSPYANS